MATPVRKPPSVSDQNDFRAREAFDGDIFRQNQMATTETKTLGSVAGGAQAVLAFAVTGARKDMGQTIEYGLPSAWNQSMHVVSAFVSDDDVVSLVIRNSSGSPITTPSGVYGIRVRP